MTVFTLRQLNYARILAETGHFGRAAERCHVTQPALSQQIRQLEEICGGALFDRGPRTVAPTPLGREFLARARRVLDEADDLERFASALADGPQRPVRFGLIPTVAPYLLPFIYPTLTAGLPGTSFSVSEGQTDHLIESLASGDLDLALIATDPPETGPRLASIPLFADPFVLACNSAKPFAEPVRLTDIPAEQILLLDEGHCFRDQAIEACMLRHRISGRTFAATSLSTIVEFVAGGQGVTLLPAISLHKEAGDPRIRICELAAPAPSRTLSLVWREATPFGELFRKVAEIIRDKGSAQFAEPLGALPY